MHRVSNWPNQCTFFIIWLPTISVRVYSLIMYIFYTLYFNCILFLKVFVRFVCFCIIGNLYYSQKDSTKRFFVNVFRKQNLPGEITIIISWWSFASFSKAKENTCETFFICLLEYIIVTKIRLTVASSINVCRLYLSRKIRSAFCKLTNVSPKLVKANMQSFNPRKPS